MARHIVTMLPFSPADGVRAAALRSSHLGQDRENAGAATGRLFRGGIMLGTPLTALTLQVSKNNVYHQQQNKCYPPKVSDCQKNCS